MRGAGAESLGADWFRLDVGSGGLAVGLTAALFVLWRYAAGRRRTIAGQAAELAGMEQRLGGLVRQAAARDGQLLQVLETLPDGVALFDDGLRLVAWNRRFPGLLPEAAQPRRGQPVTELLGGSPDLLATTTRPGQSGGRVEDGWTALADGSRLLRSRHAIEAPAPHQRSAVDVTARLASLCAEELRNRLPTLLEACAAGTLEAARDEAHAMRGVAANFGLAPLAEALLAVERAALAREVMAMREAAIGLPPQVAAGIESLSRQAA